MRWATDTLTAWHGQRCTQDVPWPFFKPTACQIFWGMFCLVWHPDQCPWCVSWCWPVGGHDAPWCSVEEDCCREPAVHISWHIGAGPWSFFSFPEQKTASITHSTSAAVAMIDTHWPASPTTYEPGIPHLVLPVCWPTQENTFIAESDVENREREKNKLLNSVPAFS